MTVNAHDDTDRPATTGPDAQEYERFGAVTLEDGVLLLYSLDDEEAWIQTDAYVSLAEMA